MQDGDIIQLAHVVFDVDVAMEHYDEKFGYGMWDIYEFLAPLLRESMYRGKPATTSNRRRHMGTRCAAGTMHR